MASLAWAEAAGVSIRSRCPALGFELENLAAGIAANAKDLPGAAAGTVFGGVTFLALGEAELGALIASIRATMPKGFLLWTVAAPLPTLLLSLDRELSRVDGAALLVWFAIALVSDDTRALYPQNTEMFQRLGEAGVRSQLFTVTPNGAPVGHGAESRAARAGQGR